MATQTSKMSFHADGTAPAFDIVNCQDPRLTGKFCAVLIANCQFDDGDVYYDGDDDNDDDDGSGDHSVREVGFCFEDEASQEFYQQQNGYDDLIGAFNKALDDGWRVDDVIETERIFMVFDKTKFTPSQKIVLVHPH